MGGNSQLIQSGQREARERIRPVDVLIDGTPAACA